MPQSIRTLLAPLLLLGIPIALAFAWGLSWAQGDFPDCASGSSFLADAGWVLQGIALGLVVGIVVPITLAVLRSFLLAVPVVIVTGVGMFLAGNAGATMAASLVGCTAWDTRGAGEAIILGMVISGVPTILLAGMATGIGALLRRPPPPSPESTRPPTDPAD
jgi:hypothetical protein